MNRKISYVISLAVALVSFQLTISAQAATTALQDDSPTAAAPDEDENDPDASLEAGESEEDNGGLL
ncbi:MAG TPA: hypothetical protein EYG03_06055 [Planctomycetes bacterium]|nr:hypothetical protein [Fuerstiella sp.]HIK91531.1 hypothetical protein [Planctomycetota bacterium]